MNRETGATTGALVLAHFFFLVLRVTSSCRWTKRALQAALFVVPAAQKTLNGSGAAQFGMMSDLSELKACDCTGKCAFMRGSRSAAQR